MPKTKHKVCDTRANIILYKSIHESACGNWFSVAFPHCRIGSIRLMPRPKRYERSFYPNSLWGGTHNSRCCSCITANKTIPWKWVFVSPIVLNATTEDGVKMLCWHFDKKKDVVWIIAYQYVVNKCVVVCWFEKRTANIPIITRLRTSINLSKCHSIRKPLSFTCVYIFNKFLTFFVWVPSPTTNIVAKSTCS